MESTLEQAMVGELVDQIAELSADRAAWKVRALSAEARLQAYLEQEEKGEDDEDASDEQISES
jgi:hypothetical protein